MLAVDLGAIFYDMHKRHAVAAPQVMVGASYRDWRFANGGKGLP